jgi:hypothetical protein
MAMVMKPTPIVLVVVLLVAAASSSVEGQTSTGCVVDKSERLLCLLAGDGVHPWYTRICCQILRSKTDDCLQCVLDKELRPTFHGLQVRRCFRAGVTCPTDGP